VTLRSGHGSGSGTPRIEVLPVDELPVGLPDAARTPSPTDRGPRGRFARGNELARKGGQARARKTRLATRLRLSDTMADPAFEPYQRAAEGFKRAQVAWLAQSVGGGYVGPGPASIVASAALQLAASRFAFDHGDHELGSKLANDSRQNLLAAHELVAREAKARPRRAADFPWLRDK
jgi:hypothetical protein